MIYRFHPFMISFHDNLIEAPHFPLLSPSSAKKKRQKTTLSGKMQVFYWSSTLEKLKIFYETIHGL